MFRFEAQSEGNSWLLDSFGPRVGALGDEKMGLLSAMKSLKNGSEDSL
jgi:hypothetical protein